MRKKALIILIVLSILATITMLSGCNRVRTSKDYYLYTYQGVLGDFAKNTSKITFDRDNYTIFNNNGTVINVGEHSTNNGMVSFVPDKIGNVSQIAATTCMYVYDQYLIETAQVISRVSNLQFEDKSDLEGIYNAGFKLSDEIIYESTDGSDSESSYTEKVGTYDENRDFVICYYETGAVVVLLQLEYVDGFGNKVCGLAPRFYSYKDPSLKNIKVSGIELYDKIFVKSTSGTYDLSLLVYPKKSVVTDDVTYKVLTNTVNASINGKTLTFNGTGNVQIEYSYDNYKNTELVYIVDTTVKAGIVDADRTYSVGDVEDYDDIISKVADYLSDWSTYEYVEISNTAKAESKNGSVTFKEAGTVDVVLYVRYLRNYADGDEKVVETKITTITLIIN